MKVGRKNVNAEILFNISSDFVLRFFFFISFKSFTELVTFHIPVIEVICVIRLKMKTVEQHTCISIS